MILRFLFLIPLIKQKEAGAFNDASWYRSFKGRGRYSLLVCPLPLSWLGLWDLCCTPLQQYRAMLCNPDLRCAPLTYRCCFGPPPEWCTMRCCQSRCTIWRTTWCEVTSQNNTGALMLWHFHWAHLSVQLSVCSLDFTDYTLINISESTWVWSLRFLRWIATRLFFIFSLFDMTQGVWIL